jgi:hypothetical protein
MKFTISESERNEILKQYHKLINEQGGGASVSSTEGLPTQSNVQQQKNYTVTDIQTYLNKMGNYGITVDGVLGPKTIEKYNDYISKMVRVPEVPLSDVREPEAVPSPPKSSLKTTSIPDPPPPSLTPEPQVSNEPEITLDSSQTGKLGNQINRRTKNK